MSYYEKKCPSCGNTYIGGDKVCRSCGAELPNNNEVSDADLLDGMLKSDWHLFIDKNSSRYADIFAKNEGKKFFLHKNWAAFLFGFYWLFYRRMYKYGVIFLILSILFSTVVTAGLFAAYKDDIKPALDMSNVYTGYTGTDENGVYYSEFNATELSEEMLEHNNSYNKAIKKSTSALYKILFWSVFFGALFNLAFSLCADCLYRRFVMLKIGSSQGGTSVPSVIAAVIINAVISETLVAFISKLLVNAIIL